MLNWVKAVLAAFGMEIGVHILASVTDGGPDIKRLCRVLLKRVSGLEADNGLLRGSLSALINKSINQSPAMTFLLGCGTAALGVVYCSPS